MITEEEFERLFQDYTEDDVISIKDLKKVLVAPKESRPEIFKFLDSRIIDYKFDNSTKSLRQRSAMVINHLTHKFGRGVTFREILEDGYFPEKMLGEGQIGLGCIEVLMNTYRLNGVEDVYKYQK